MGTGRPLEPGTYYVGVYNSHASEAAAYTVESRGIGNGQAITVADLSPAAGSSATISNLAPREAAYFKVTIPANTPSWEFTLSPSAGEMMMAMRRGTIPDFGTGENGNYYLQDNSINGSREVEMQKAGPERYLVLPPNGQDYIVAGDYYIAVIGEGVNPPNSSTIGTGTSSGVLTSLGTHVATNLGTASLAGITQPVSLTSAQVKSYQFTVQVGTASLEVRLDNRVGDPWMSLISGSRIPQPSYGTSSTYYGFADGQYSVPTGGVSRIEKGNLITIANPPPGPYSLTLRAGSVSGNYPDASADLVIRQMPRVPLNYAASLNGNGQSHTDTRQLLDTQKAFYEVAVPATLGGQPVLGWLIKMNHLQGDTTLKVYKTWGNPDTGVTITGNTALIVPPFLTPGDTWFVEVQGTGLTNYTITSLPITLERPAWTMPTGHNTTFGDSGNDSSGSPLPGDRGVDIGQDDWHFYAIDVPEGNAGLLRTELQAINGNPNLYIREDGVPTTDHQAGGVSGGSLVHRSLTSTASEYGNWVPLDGRYQKQLRAGRWYLGVKATGASNARYRLKVSTGQVVDLALDGGAVTNQNLVGRDWRYYRFTLPADAPNNWNLTFSQQVGDVNMWLRDTTPPGNGTDGLESTSGLRTWYSDTKNQGPYSYSGQDAAGTYTFDTAQLRPGHTYYVGFRAENDATFSLNSTTSGGTTGVLPSLDYYTGTVNTSIPAGGSLLYRIPAPPEATRMKWTATHPGTVEMRLEQGTLPGTTGSQHWTSGSSANVAFNYSLTNPTGWPWLPDQTYYLRVTNTSGSAQPVTLTMNGKNAATEDEDNDGLPDAWENQYFGYYGNYNGASDPDSDGVTNTVEFADGTLPNDGSSAKYSLTIIANGGSVSKSPDLPKYFKGSAVTLTATPAGGSSFIGWSGALGGSVNAANITLNANSTVTAVFGIVLPTALDTSNLTWVQGGNGPWFGQAATTHDGTDAAQSGAISNSQESWMETTVTGSGNLTFWWKVSSQSGGDFLEFYLDGVLQSGRISGTVDWVQKTYPLGSGSHTLRWRYQKDSSSASGSDAGWIDQVVWAPTNPYATWAGQNFSAAELADPLVSGASADPDKDGIPNLVEFVLGGNPAAGQNQSLLPTMSLVSNPGGTVPNGDYFRFTYRRVPAATSLTPGMEFSNSLVGSWTNATGASGVVEVVTPNFYASPTTADKVEVYVPRAAHSVNGRLFGRLRVATSP